MMKITKKLCNSCGELNPIWKNSGGKRFCRRCWSAHSVTTKPQPTGKQKKIPSRSPKRSKQEAEYSKLRKEFLTKYPMCQAHLPQVCTQVSTDVHHMKGRIGDLLLDEAHWLSVCRGCHYWIEMRPQEAKQLGFSKNRNYD
jgi:hypothetical protein